MDSGWAVILGAVIALVSSAVLPWIRDFFSERRAERVRRERAIDKGIRDIVHALTTASHARPSTLPERAKIEIEARDVLTAFELLLDGRSQPLAVALDQAFEDALSKDDWLRMSARSSMPILLTGWRSGLYTGSDVYKQYSEGRTRYPEQASE